jgi:CRISPR-associated protein Csm4
MQYYQITFHLRSPLMTPFQSDIIFGHLAWGWRYLRGKAALKDLLVSLDEDPPLISAAFPEGKLPKPILPDPPHSERDDLAEEEATREGGDFKSAKVKALRAFKAMKKIPYIPEDRFADLAKGLSRSSLFRCLKDVQEEGERAVQVTVGHNTINRITGRVTEDGGLHPAEETFYPRDFKFWCWMTGGGVWGKSEIEELWDYVAKSGFGADASTGKGRLEVDSIQEKTLPEPAGCNALISLSQFIPAKTVPNESFWDIGIKYGRLGGHYANRPKFYKSVLMMFQPGTVLKMPSDFPKPIGSVVHHVNPDPDIVHYAHAFPYPVKRTEESL